MRGFSFVAACAILLGHFASAELQNVDIGGSVQVRSRNWINGQMRPQELRIPDFFLPGRAIGLFGTSSRFSWDNRGASIDVIELDTRLHITADFTSEVSAYIEFESFDLGGQDFRSDYRTGLDHAANSSDDIEVLFSYIQAEDFLGYPLRLRIGRQPLRFGRGWLVSDRHNPLRGNPYDGARLTYTGSDFSIDGWWTILNEEQAFVEEDGDVTFSGLHGTYTGFQGHEFSAFWLWVRDPRALNDTNFIAPLEWVEDWFGLDDYDTTNLHTVGIRAVGGFGQFDYALDAAYQFGEYDQLGFRFKPFIYGDTGVDMSEYAADLELGYTFDMNWSPRVYVGGAYFSGEDNRDLTLFEWLNPFDRPEASTAFNRLFSSTGYLSILDNPKDMSNFWQIRGGTSFSPSEKVLAQVEVGQFGAVDTFDRPAAIDVGGFEVPIAPALPFLTQSTDDDMGWYSILQLTYAYTETLSFKFTYEYLLTGPALAEGNFQHFFGQQFNGGSDDDDAQYIELRAEIKF